ncbi:MAG: TIGR00153 family protein, partial [Gammaproteobacteria bacterium]
MPASSILNVFGRSPIRPVQKHMTKVYKCTQVLPDFFKAVLAKNWEEAKKLQQNIAKIEREADEIKRDVRSHLPKSLFMPVARADILELLRMQDWIANRTKDIAGLVIGRQMVIPDNIIENFNLLTERTLDAIKQAHKAISELDQLQETGFSGHEVEEVCKMIDELMDIEQQTDDLQNHICQQIFFLEKELPAVDVIFLYKTIEWIGN